MSRKVVFALSLVLVLVTAVAQAAVFIPVPPIISLPADYVGIARQAADSVAVSGQSQINISGTKSNINTDFELTSTGTDPLSIVLPIKTGNLNKKGTTKPILYTFKWAETTLGPKTGEITLSSTSATLGDNTAMSVTGNVVANREMDVTAIGTATEAVRIMKKAVITTTMSTGDDAMFDSDAYATRLINVP